MRPVPIAPLTVAVHVVREGRSVELVEASLTPDDGKEVMRARALRIRTEPGVAPRVAADPPTPDFTTAQDDGSFRFPWDIGYHTAMECRFSSGTFLERGPAACWLRMKVALVAGEKIAPLDRVLVAADSGNGVSNALDMAAHVFINPDLTVHLHRHPTGEWVCIDSATTVEADGIGLADTVLHDQDGPIGRSAQSLFIAGRD
jgi:hypothetical protein